MLPAGTFEGGCTHVNKHKLATLLHLQACEERCQTRQQDDQPHRLPPLKLGREPPQAICMR